MITGASGSGKSAYAEELLLKYAGDRKKFYLATMRRDGGDAKARIARHEALRYGKGFTTIECPHKLPAAEELRGAAVLLEDIPNLLANRMFSKETDCPFYGTILEEILKLDRECSLLICVSGDLFSDGMHYDAYTDEYLRELGRLCCGLAEEAGALIEVYCGIPEWIKGEAVC